MNDVQQERPKHQIPINQVGIKDLRYPIRVLDRAKGYQDTVAQITMLVDLPAHYRGTHMSRFVEILNKYKGEIAYKELRPILEDMRRTFEAECAHISMSFPYFVEKEAPVTGTKSLMEYTAFFSARLSEEYEFVLGVRVPVLTLCPCSKEISDYGAHNQRAYVTVEVKFSDFVWLEELIEVAESSASSPVYSLLKRPDEKFVTEHAYDNPHFVEDVVRSVAVKLKGDPRILWARVSAESMESIHNHNAYAMIEFSRRE